ncbi:MAG TPA: (Fe-S)-binding protein [Candidatus Paceibacterota bacterium]|nr:(Fe-S)-binding protein [Candidatus Paceibacterota bacterium]
MRVGIFATCINSLYYTRTVEATRTVLERLGVVIADTEQVCCGQMHINSGYPELAKPLIDRVEKNFADCDYIVAPSASCIGSLREHEDRPELVSKCFDLSEFLIDILNVTDVGATFNHRVTLHTTCHSLRVAKLGDKPQQLLRAVRGLDLIELPAADSCCGFGGTFSVKNSDVSGAMLHDKLTNIVSTAAEYVVSADNSCLMHIGGGLQKNETPIEVIHLAEILASRG